MTDKKFGILYFVSQAGATDATFDERRFQREVFEPIELALEIQKLIDFVLVVVPCGKGVPNAELPTHEIVEDEGLPEHIFTPTSRAVCLHMHHRIGQGKVDFLNVSWQDKKICLDHAEQFMKNQGVEYCFIVDRQNSRFPSPEELIDKKSGQSLCDVAT